MGMWTCALATALAVAGGAAEAQETERPAVLRQLFECRRIAGVAERAACYDGRVDALERAERARDLVVVDREQVRRTRRSLFGFNLPRLRLFGRDDDSRDEPEFRELNTAIKSASRAGGGWSFTLEDDARWVQADNLELAREPRPGQRIRIRQGALGSFLANVDGQVAIRVRRVN